MSASVPAPSQPRALVADDEPLLREHLVRHLRRLWPELDVVAEARNGREAVALFEQHRPAVVFLDVHMPGLSGVEAARAIGELDRGAQIVFVTAFEQYAVQAFERGAVDYLVKPFEESRLAGTVARLRERLQASPALPDGLLDRLAEALRDRLPGPAAAGAPPTGHLRWIRASSGANLRLIPVEEVVFLRSDEKYTLVVHEGGEALIRRTIRELADELDPAVFVQVHRSVIVNLRHVAQVVRGPHDTADLHLRGRPEVLPVSRSHLHLFRQM